jgi:TPR repeat protein
MFNLGRMHALGKGCELDHSIAVQWLRKAATNGNESAIDYLAALLNREKNVHLRTHYTEGLDWALKSKNCFDVTNEISAAEREKEKSSAAVPAQANPPAQG